MNSDNLSENLFPHYRLNKYISSVDTFSTQHDYSFTSRSSWNSASNVSATSVRTANFNSTSGYGLINAAAAVARAAGLNSFGDVPSLGGNNWGADLVKAPAAWAQGYTGKGVVVAVLDTGVDYNHADLKNNIWTNPGEIAGNGIDNDGNGYIDDAQGWNFADNSNNVIDVNGHGSHVAGTIAGTNNGFGVTGIAYDAKIMPVKVLGDGGSGNSNSLADGIYYAVNNGANVINLSLGGNFPNSTIENAIEYASSKGAVVVMAAGNNGYPFTGYPASYAENWGLAVGAVDKKNNMASFSNRAGMNAFPYVTAPGEGVYSTVPGNDYATYSGTSMATPHVAGVVALMLSANPNLTDAAVRQIIIETAGNSTSVAGSYDFNFSSVVDQAIAQIGNNTISVTTIDWELNITNVTEGDTTTSPETSTSLFNLGKWIRYDDRTMKNIGSFTMMNIFNNDDVEEGNGDFTDIEKIISQLQQQLAEFSRFFPGF
ncbi:S8 family peptidase [Nodularia harveyana UHCC-0300]|uniref:S8 family peptidase n=1 Tax=Nodularia harveyana UHCC-0300 TaxID=2974287 RepID=A0ABU5UEV6_9CYAN|nr:S8 family peptidase [Nodularia harveyana]MEA5582082.1 S8 family peptidase [Nodularia harveyana UHCC-0300]